ncbi:serine/threonine protein kinase [Streptomyces sp. NBC_01551]|uniref:serine/threonine-protein kinase n=1 Tax=Streptomyces sp. NBC_01551 TaxID=2975876 RepID=UPI002252BBBD|nr:serine/threonine-protein kinase [Streptomyces sp. NBC_01551]MCX4529328.1 serine/threonine protein kinase [Streptomyces sp. NBC_01551]
MVYEPLREKDPREIAGFRLTRRLGQGAMGVVYLGYRSTRPVAIKVIKPALADQPYFRQRFAQELEAIRRVGGFHTAALVAADPDAEQPWIATEYVHAPSLEGLLNQHGAVSELGAWWLAASLSDALIHIHSVRLLHRDLKPSNVLVTTQGTRVIDFGVCHVGGATGLTSGDAPVGTLVYMAPEQAMDSRKASEAADVYSLGATLVHAATGHPPFYADMPVQRILDVPPDLSGLPESLRELIVGALSYAPEARPTAHSVLEAAMDRLLEHAVPVSGPLYPPLPASFLKDVLQVEGAPPVPPVPPEPAPAREEPAAPEVGGGASAEPAPAGASSGGGAPWADRWRGKIRDRRSDFGG